MVECGIRRHTKAEVWKGERKISVPMQPGLLSPLRQLSARIMIRNPAPKLFNCLHFCNSICLFNVALLVTLSCKLAKSGVEKVRALDSLVMHCLGLLVRRGLSLRAFPQDYLGPACQRYPSSYHRLGLLTTAYYHGRGVHTQLVNFIIVGNTR